MKGARFVVLGIALAAGGAAAYLVSSNEAPPAQQIAAPPVQQLNVTEVLVAAGDIGIGQGLSPQAVRWQIWPTDAATSANYIRKPERPNAIQQISGSVTRAAFSAGEPIRDDKLIKANGSGYLAAVLPPGMRAISTPISPETGAGGFILPNDRVDVLLIRVQRTGGASESYSSETVLSNVRVLAIDQTVEEKNGQRVVVGKIATLALNGRNAETLTLATRLGTIALALRSIADAQQGDDDDEKQTSLNSRETIDVVRYGRSIQVLK